MAGAAYQNRQARAYHLLPGGRLLPRGPVPGPAPALGPLTEDQHSSPFPPGPDEVLSGYADERRGCAPRGFFLDRYVY